MYRKINLFKNGEYICSTTQRKTLKEAVQKFKENPTYQTMVKGLSLAVTVDTQCNTITAKYAD